MDDRSTVVLRERGGLETVMNETIRSQVTCLRADPRRYELSIVGVSLDQSVLGWLARNQRPTVLQDPSCLYLER